MADITDLQQARKAPQELSGGTPLWKHLGPGLITGAADDDPSGIGTYSVAGAQFGYGLLWLVPYCIPLMIAVQEMCGRIGAVTGKGLAAILKEHYPRWILWGAVGLLFVANTINVYADFNVMAASAKMLFHGPFFLWLTLLTVVTLGLQVFVPYRSYVRFLKWMCLALLAYVVTDFWPGVHNNWGLIARNLFMPHWSKDPAFILTVVGFLGTTISPYLFFWQAGETVEEEIAEGKAVAPGQRQAACSDAEMRQVRADTIIGMVASQAVTFFIILCTKSQLFDHHLNDINTAQDAARALIPLGAAAYWLFTLGILGTGLLAIPTLAGSAAYGLAETFGWRYGLYRRFQRARGFYATIAAVILIGFGLNFVKSISPIKGLLYSAVLNGLVAPPLIVLLLMVCNNAKIVGERRNGLWSNLLGWLAVILMTIAAALMIWGMATGKM
ncbi:MAG TPA: divalent metal cation transporter [Chthonomonadaceae bacterium]|nr:divalent metal cation transporter [Chthonomonadaceae bacterium]